MVHRGGRAGEKAHKRNRLSKHRALDYTIFNSRRVRVSRATRPFTLFRKNLFALLYRGNRRSRASSQLLGFPQGAKTLHILANRNGLLFDIRHRSRAFFRSQTLPVGTRDALRRRYS
jgi:hypothetical protein